VKILEISLSDLVVSDDLRRSGSAKQFEDRLRSSIEEIGLAEPIKVARMPSGKYLVVDGTMRLRAIQSLHETDQKAFSTVQAYVTDYERRFEIRYQTDIYQDLLPSQLAALVEHLHEAERVRKLDIARYIGVSPATLRNYTGLARLLKRGELSARIVELMDVGVIPSSNPFAWLRLTDAGIRAALEHNFAEEGETAEAWLDQRISAARQGHVARYITAFVESATDRLAPDCYREDEEVRTLKRDFGLRRAAVHAESKKKPAPRRDASVALSHLRQVSRRSPDPVLKSAARSLQAYLI
jgi:ParB-like chromosome segregation protein Spo0J